MDKMGYVQKLSNIVTSMERADRCPTQEEKVTIYRKCLSDVEGVEKQARSKGWHEIADKAKEASLKIRSLVA